MMQCANVPIDSKSVPKTGTNGTEQARARVRETERCSVPFPVPFRPVNVPISQPVEIHGKPCRLIADAGWYVITDDQGLASHRSAHGTPTGSAA